MEGRSKGGGGKKVLATVKFLKVTANLSAKTSGQRIKIEENSKLACLQS